MDSPGFSTSLEFKESATVTWAPDDTPLVPTRHCRRPHRSPPVVSLKIVEISSVPENVLFNRSGLFCARNISKLLAFLIFRYEIKITIIITSIKRGTLSNEDIFVERKKKFFEKDLLIIFIDGARVTLVVSPEPPDYRDLRTNR